MFDDDMTLWPGTSVRRTLVRAVRPDARRCRCTAPRQGTRHCTLPTHTHTIKQHSICTMHTIRAAATKTTHEQQRQRWQQRQ